MSAADVKQHGLMDKSVVTKNVFFYRNGVRLPPKRIVFNPRQTRTFDGLLDKVTKDLKMRVAARNVVTPTGKHRIRNLEDLESERDYVAIGSERFKRIQ